jgi:hypothetical protein
MWTRKLKVSSALETVLCPCSHCITSVLLLASVVNETHPSWQPSPPNSCHYNEWKGKRKLCQYLYSEKTTERDMSLFPCFCQCSKKQQDGRKSPMIERRAFDRVNDKNSIVESFGQKTIFFSMSLLTHCLYSLCEWSWSPAVGSVAVDSPAFLVITQSWLEAQCILLLLNLWRKSNLITGRDVSLSLTSFSSPPFQQKYSFVFDSRKVCSKSSNVIHHVFLSKETFHLQSCLCFKSWCPPFPV